MTTRRTLLLGLGGLALGGGSYIAGAFHEARKQAGNRLFGQGTVIETGAGPLEYAVAGDGPPLMMIHGTGGGFDQGLLFAAGLRRSGFRIVACQSALNCDPVSAPKIDPLGAELARRGAVSR